jgi:hypothetical protein
MNGMLIRTLHGERRLTPPLHKLLLTAHIVASVGWLGITTAKLVLLLTAGRAMDSSLTAAMLMSTAAVDRAFPPVAVLTLVTGVALGLVTKWGIVQYSWVLMKLVLTVVVPVTAVRIGDRFLLEALAGGPVMPLFWLAVAHGLMLLAATVLSVYKPWGKSWFGVRSRGLEARLPVR